MNGVNYFQIKKVAVSGEKKTHYRVWFECEGGRWSNDFILPIKEEPKEATMDRIIALTRKMIADKDRERELEDFIVGKEIPLNGAK